MTQPIAAVPDVTTCDTSIGANGRHATVAAAQPSHVT